MKSSRRLKPLCYILGFCLLVYVVTSPWPLYVWGLIRNEHFYKGWPTIYWRAHMEDWSSADLLTGEPEAFSGSLGPSP